MCANFANRQPTTNGGKPNLPRDGNGKPPVLASSDTPRNALRWIQDRRADAVIQSSESESETVLAKGQGLRMKWNVDCDTGVQHIDEDHKLIFKMAEDFHAALDVGRGDAVYSMLLESLSLFCRGHFGFEEQCMEELSCPVAEKNNEENVRLFENLSKFQELYAANGYDHTDAGRLIDTVEQWLEKHISRIDVHLKRCVNK